MRIKNIATADQRAAVTAAIEAARLVVDRIAEAKLLELAIPDREDGVTAYRPLNVWGEGTTDKDERFCTREWLWCDVAGEDGHHRLTDDDVTKLTELLRNAADRDPNVFNPGELASGAWELDLDAVLAAAGSDAAERLVALIGELQLEDIDLDDLVDTAGAPMPPASHDEVIAANDAIQEANDNGVTAQAQFLVDKLGETEAFAAVKLCGSNA